MSDGGKAMKTVLVGVFDALNDATQARAALLESGFPERTISLRSKENVADRTRSDPAIFDNRTDEMRDEPGVFDWLRSLFGQDDAHDEEATVYSEAVERGEYLLTVDEVPEVRVQTAVDIIEHHGAIDVDERLQQRRRSEVSPAVARGDDLPGIAGRLPAAGPDGIRSDVDQDFGHRELDDDHRYKLDEQGYPPLQNADPADVARLEARRDRRAAVKAARRGKVRVLQCEPRTVKPG
jgi:hypothetical protein